MTDDKLYAVYKASENHRPYGIYADKLDAEVVCNSKFLRGFVRELHRIEAIELVIRMTERGGK